MKESCSLTEEEKTNRKEEIIKGFLVSVALVWGAVFISIVRGDFIFGEEIIFGIGSTAILFIYYILILKNLHDLKRIEKIAQQEREKTRFLLSPYGKTFIKIIALIFLFYALFIFLSILDVFK